VRFSTARRGYRIRAPAGQTVTVVAEANSPQELQAATPLVDEIPAGVRGQVVIHGPMIGPLADLMFAEQIWGRNLVPAGVRVIDVHGEGTNTAIVEWLNPAGAAASLSPGEARHEFVIAAVVVLGAVAIALLALGWVINKITVLFFGPEAEGRGFDIGLIALAAAGVGVALILWQTMGRRAGST